MKKSVLAIALFALGTLAQSGQAADAVKSGQEAKSATGVEKVIALGGSGNDVYWVSTFVRAGNCPEKSGKCANDAINVRGPGGVINIAVEDASGAGGFFSQTKNPVAVVLLPANKGGYVYASAEIYTFTAEKKPQSVLKTAEVLLNNLEGAACEGKKLCADSKLTASFAASATPEYPDVILRQTGTTMNQAGTALEKLDRTFSFTFDAKTKLYVAKR
ncbi:MAG: hypothetical protein V4495_13580 [Pseudomonadota bacterium]